MRRTQKLGLLGLILLSGVVARSCAGQPGLKENERIVFLGDSITQAGTQPDGYVTLVSRSITAAYPHHGIQVLGAGREGNRLVAEEILRALGVPLATLAEERPPHRKDTP